MIDMMKINVFSKNEIIKKQFLKTINADCAYELTKKIKMGVEFAVLNYFQKYMFQFWLMSNEKRFELTIPSLLRGQF